MIESGYHPAVDLHNRLVFYFDRRTRTQATLFASSFRNPGQRTKITDVERSRARVTTSGVDPETAPVVVPNGGGIVYVGSGGRLTRYWPDSRKSERLPVTNCNPVLVRTRTGDILCTNLRDRSWYLVSLANANVRALPAADGSFSAVYDPENDVLYLGKMAVRDGKEQSDMYRLPFSTGKALMFAPGVFFSTGVWVPPAVSIGPR